MNIVDAKKPLVFVITSEHVRRAKCKNPNKCVIAQALTASIGVLFEKVSVGACTTKIYAGNKVIRYRTPDGLRNALHHFDVSGKWDLAPGTYQLAAMPASHRIGQKRNRSSDVGRKRSGNHAKAARTRIVERVAA